MCHTEDVFVRILEPSSGQRIPVISWYLFALPLWSLRPLLCPTLRNVSYPARSFCLKQRLEVVILRGLLYESGLRMFCSCDEVHLKIRLTAKHFQKLVLVRWDCLVTNNLKLKSTK